MAALEVASRLGPAEARVEVWDKREAWSRTNVVDSFAVVDNEHSGEPEGLAALSVYARLGLHHLGLSGAWEINAYAQRMEGGQRIWHASCCPPPHTAAAAAAATAKVSLVLGS